MVTFSVFAEDVSIVDGIKRSVLNRAIELILEVLQLKEVKFDFRQEVINRLGLIVNELHRCYQGIFEVLLVRRGIQICGL